MRTQEQIEASISELFESMREPAIVQWMKVMKDTSFFQVGQHSVSMQPFEALQLINYILYLEKKVATFRVGK
jgi:hypothetical protein